MTIYDELYQHVVKHYLKGQEPAATNGDCELIASGILNSLSLVHLIAHIESKYHITFGMEDMVMETFESISALERFINSKREQF